jgi:hypothetical protein
LLLFLGASLPASPTNNKRRTKNRNEKGDISNELIEGTFLKRLDTILLRDTIVPILPSCHPASRLLNLFDNVPFQPH